MNIDVAAPAEAAQGENGVFAGCRLASHFQPIYSLAHRQAVAYEGLVRAQDGEGRPIDPMALFAMAPRGERRIQLDRMCRRLHVETFQRFGETRSWLFLNVDSYVAAEGARHGSFLQPLLERNGLTPQRVAIELIETQVDDEQRLAAAVEYYRELGCLIVIDDFGAGHSNFDRIWRLRPDVVKIDREMTRRVGIEPLARRMFSGIVQLMHEAGALVCVEGIESEDEALCSIDAGADLVQGYYFSRAAPELPAPDACRGKFGRLFAGFRAEISELQDRRHTSFKPYIAALLSAGDYLAGGVDLERAAKLLLELDYVQRCYLIAADGSQIGNNLEASRNADARDPRLEPILPGPGTNWQTKPYFRRALEAPGRIQITRPYMSITGPKICVTLSLAFRVPGETQVLCADVDFAALAGDDLAFGVKDK